MEIAGKKTANVALKNARVKKGMTQLQIADYVGTSALNVKRWEGGTRPRKEFQNKLCQLFEKSPQELGFADEAEVGNAFISATVPDCYDSAIPLPPDEARRLVGRDHLLAGLKQHLFQHKGSLALWGLPGVGKTALAIALARDEAVVERFRDGILWAGVGAQPGEIEHLSRWGRLLGVSLDHYPKPLSTKTWARAIREVIGTRSILIIIDDVWEIQVAHNLKVGGINCAHLITTRIPAIAYQFAGNQGATAVPELGEQESLAILEHLAPTATRNDPTGVTELASSVGGLPLALQLMGNYLRVQGHNDQPRRIHTAIERLKLPDERFELSEASNPAEYTQALPVGMPRTFKRIVALSEWHLDEQARYALRALSLFPEKPNSFPEEAALAVSNVPAQALDALADAGLLETTEKGRYTLHQTIADYARLHFDDTEAKKRLIVYFVYSLEGHQKTSEVFEKDVKNIIKALELAADLGMADTLLRGVTLFVPFLLERGLHEPAETLLKQVVVLPQGNDEQLARIKLYLGQIAELHGRLVRAEQFYQEGLVHARRTSLPELISDLLTYLSGTLVTRGEYTQADPYLKEGLQVARALQNRKREATILKSLGESVQSHGDLAGGENYYQEALELARQLKDFELMSIVFQNQGVIEERYGRYEQAQKLYKKALFYATRIGSPQRQSAALMNLGMVAFLQEDYREAELHYKKCLSIARSLGHDFRESSVLQNLGMLESARGNITKAEEYMQQSLEIAQRNGLQWLEYETSNEQGYLYLKQGRVSEAAALFCRVIEAARQSELKELAAAAHFGLAQVAAACNDGVKAQKEGLESLKLYQDMEYAKAEQVRKWLASLPQESM